MLIYHLVVKVHTNEHAETYCFTDVFSTLALAVKRGCREIENHIDMNRIAFCGQEEWLVK